MTEPGRRILIVDDNPDVAQIMRMAARKLERKVEVVSEVNADRALDRLSREHFDLVISDYRMREMDGLTFLAGARPAEPDEVRLLFTAYGAKLDQVALAKARLDGVLEKPLPLDALRVVLDAVLDHEPSTMAALRNALEARAAPPRG